MRHALRFILAVIPHPLPWRKGRGARASAPRSGVARGARVAARWRTLAAALLAVVVALLAPVTPARADDWIRSIGSLT